MKPAITDPHQLDLFTFDYSENSFTMSLKTAIQEVFPAATPVKAQNKLPQDAGKVIPALKNGFLVYQGALEAEAHKEIAGKLSKDWATPNYQNLLQHGLPLWKVSAIRALRDALPEKARVRYQGEWRQMLTKFRDLAIGILRDEYQPQQFQETVRKLGNLTTSESRASFLNTESTRVSLASDVLAHYQMYLRLGHEHDLSAYHIAYETDTIFAEDYNPSYHLNEEK